MFGNSSPVISNQVAVHPDLDHLVQKYRQHPLTRPVAISARRQFDWLNDIVTTHGGSLILDLGCGNGESTRQLAQQYPQALVIGVDRSLHRLGIGNSLQQDNCILLRLKLEDFSTLAADSNWNVSTQYFLYPNPWPKAKHLGRRLYACAWFPLLLQLGGSLEMRCNWQIFALEFYQVLQQYRYYDCTLEQLPVNTPPLTPFERKYQASSHPLYRCTAAPKVVTKDQK